MLVQPRMHLKQVNYMHRRLKSVFCPANPVLLQFASFASGQGQLGWTVGSAQGWRAPQRLGLSRDRRERIKLAVELSACECGCCAPLPGNCGCM